MNPRCGSVETAWPSASWASCLQAQCLASPASAAAASPCLQWHSFFAPGSAAAPSACSCLQAQWCSPLAAGASGGPGGAPHPPCSRPPYAACTCNAARRVLPCMRSAARSHRSCCSPIRRAYLTYASSLLLVFHYPAIVGPAHRCYASGLRTSSLTDSSRLSGYRPSS